jgi:hypothetical protein
MKNLKDAVSRVSGKVAPSGFQPIQTAPSRQGKKGLVVYVSPEAAKEIKLLAVETGSSIQELGIEAWNDLLRKHNRKAIA